MDLALEGKTALVTGSTKGIGRAIAASMAAEGVSVIINGRKQSDVDEGIRQLQEKLPHAKVSGVAADIADQEQRKKLLENCPEVDILVNNMAIFTEADYQEINDEEWRRYFEINFLSGNALARAYLPKMLAKNDNGRIIFIASEAAIMPSPEMPHYSITKTMNLSLAKSLSLLTRSTTVTVNTVMPGSTLTEGAEDLLASLYPDLVPEEREKQFMAVNRSTSTIQRLIRPEEIANFVSYVSSPLAGALSGEALRMDGGIVPTIF